MSKTIKINDMKATLSDDLINDLQVHYNIDAEKVLKEALQDIENSD